MDDSSNSNVARRYPIGAEPGPSGTSFRVWAPGRMSVEVVFAGGRALPLLPDGEGYFAVIAPEARAGTRYQFRVDGAALRVPDPASRWQPEGPHGPSEVVDPAAFSWSDQAWGGTTLPGQIVYELHIGTFTPEGTFAAAVDKLAVLAELGVTLIEMMPISEFPGEFGWGYDGVDMFAPSHLYGTPDDLRRFIDEAHRLGLGVILDVVYNHLGPDGNYLRLFTPAYFETRHLNEWGDAINFDAAGSDGVREFFLTNAGYWIEEFHFDGLRLDATQAIHDDSEDHILAAITRRVRAAGGARSTILVAENEPQDTILIRPTSQGGYGIDAIWNDDFHHSAIVATNGRRKAYYSDHAGTAQEFIAAAKYGFLFQGQTYSWQAGRRGRAGLDLPPAQFVTFIDNHDQIANTGHGKRFQQRTTPGRARAMTALMLLCPGTPMLFQGQEFWATTPFLYFADHEPELAKAVDDGRREFLAQFPNLADEDMSIRLPSPSDRLTFERSKLDWRERLTNADAVLLHRDLIRLRRTVDVFRSQRPRGLDGVVLGQEALGLRFFSETHADRLLLFNLGLDLNPASIADPLVAPPFGKRWQIEWSSENPRYGGGGTGPVEHKGGWSIPGHAAIVLAAVDDDGTELPHQPVNPALRAFGRGPASDAA